MDKICLPVFHFSLLIVVLVASLLWGFANYLSNEDDLTGVPVSTINTAPAPPPPNPNVIDDLQTGELPPRLRDKRRLYDPFKEPKRRYTDWPNTPPYGNVNISTSGYLEPYHVMGYLNQKGNEGEPGNPNQMLKLFGRRVDKYRYEYYVEHHKDPGIKIPLNVSGNREFMDGDNIKVPGYPSEYKVNLYDIEAPKYIPNY